HVGVDRVGGIEIDVAGLHRFDLGRFVELEQVGEVVADARVFGGGRLDRLGQFGMARGQPFEGGVVQSAGAALAAMGAQGGKGGGDRHRRFSWNVPRRAWDGTPRSGGDAANGDQVPIISIPSSQDRVDLRRIPYDFGE